MALAACRIRTQRTHTSLSTRRQHSLGFAGELAQQPPGDRMQHRAGHGAGCWGRSCKTKSQSPAPAAGGLVRGLDPPNPLAAAAALLVFRGFSWPAIRTDGSRWSADQPLQSGRRHSRSEPERGVFCGFGGLKRLHWCGDRGGGSRRARLRP